MPQPTRPRRPGKYGRRPANPRRPVIRLSRSLTGIVPAHPGAVDYLQRFSGTWNMLGNGPDPANVAAGVPADGCGDCVAVWWANTRRLVTAWLTPTERYPTLQETITFYKTQNPRFPRDDNGMMVADALGTLVKTGGPDGQKALGYAAVDYTNLGEVLAALAIFGSLCPGVAVTAANEDEFAEELPWDYVSGSPDVGGHCVLMGGYGPPGPGALAGDVRFETWTEETSFTDRFLTRQFEELYAVIWPEHLKDDAFLAGVNVQQFADDYTAITGRPFPVPVPGPPNPTPPAPTPDVPTAADAALWTTAGPWAAQTRTRPDLVTLKSSLETWKASKGFQ